jgi:hypothetical protein
VLEAKLEALITLTAAERRKPSRWATSPRSSAARPSWCCARTPASCLQFRSRRPPGRPTALDALRPRLQRLRALTDRADDTELALGSDIPALLDGYALAKVGGKGTALDTLKDAMQTRLSRKPRKPGTPPPEPFPWPPTLRAGGPLRLLPSSGAI